MAVCARLRRQRFQIFTNPDRMINKKNSESPYIRRVKDFNCFGFFREEKLMMTCEFCVRTYRRYGTLRHVTLRQVTLRYVCCAFMHPRANFFAAVSCPTGGAQWSKLREHKAFCLAMATDFWTVIVFSCQWLISLEWNYEADESCCRKVKAHGLWRGESKMLPTIE